MKFSSSSLSLFGKARRNKFGIGSAIFLTTFGVLFIGISSLFFMDDLRSRGWPSVNGTVTDVRQYTDSDGNRMYSPTVGYKVDGQAYSVSSNVSTSEAVNVGDNRQVRYNHDKPAEGVIAISGMGLLIYLFPLIGVLTILWGVAGFIHSMRRSAAIKRLKQSGTKLQGVVTGVESTSRSGVRLGVSATDQTGQVRTFASDDVTGNTFALLDYQSHPIAMDVYVDPANPDNYYVDLDDVPALSADKIASLLKAATTNKPFGNNVPQTSATPPAPTPVSNPAGTDSKDVPPVNNYR